MGEEKKESGVNREDSAGANREESYKSFVKDQRKFTGEHASRDTEYRRRESGGEKDEAGKRHSYNPNFTRDNRPVGEKREYTPREGGERREYTPREGGDKPRYGERRPYGDRPSYGDRPAYQKREYTPREGGERREYGNRPSYGEKREYTPREGGERREYTPREGGDKPRYGERRPYGDRPSYGDRPAYQKREYTPREGGERREYTPREGGERREGGNRPYGDRPYQKREYTPREGGERREYTPREGGDKPRYGERRPYGDKPFKRDSNQYGRNSGQQSRGGYGNSRPAASGNKKREGREAFPNFTFDNYPTFPAPPIEDKIRLNRYISMSGICSRREADEFITSGVVTVNGEVVTELGAKVSANDVIMFNNNLIQNEKKVYIVMNKPKGYVTSVEDPHADKTVMELLNNGCRERVYPVGRLDKNSLGVLLITNDGDLAKKLTHPSFEKKKVYQVSLDKPLTKADMQSIADGITLDDGDVHADAISYVGEKKTEIGIEIHSGRNRIVRRIFEHLGYRVQKLDRVYFAGLTKQRLKRGAWRFLTPREVQCLLSGQYE